MLQFEANFAYMNNAQHGNKIDTLKNSYALF